MKRLRLENTLGVSGHDVWNRPATLVVEPHRENRDGWLWRVAGQDIPITPELFSLGFLGRTISMRFKDHVFNEFEHLAFLHLIGVRGVRVELVGNGWPPYMCSTKMLDQALTQLRPNGKLQPYASEGQAVCKPLRRDRMRMVRYTPLDSGLVLHANVDYGTGKAGSFSLSVYERSAEAWSTAIGAVAQSRSLGRPKILRPLVDLASHAPILNGRWPHKDKLLWPSNETGALEYEELARHRVLDGALLSFAAPEGTFLSGTIEFFYSGHPMDLEILKLIARPKVTAFKQIA